MLMVLVSTMTDFHFHELGLWNYPPKGLEDFMKLDLPSKNLDKIYLNFVQFR